MKDCVYHNTETGESRPVFSPPRRGRPTAQVAPHLLSVSQSREASGALELLVRGRLDVNTVLSFRDSVFSALGERPPLLRIDLRHLQALESAGIASLVTLCRVSQLVGVPCELRPSPALAKVLAQTGLDRLLSVGPASGDEIARKIFVG